MDCEYLVVGAGIVGLATAHALAERDPNTSVLVVEKEEGPARHQSGHNSGVIHSGLYYRPGSLKAQLCASGREAMFAYAAANRITCERSGKLVVATEDRELPLLQNLYDRGLQHGLQLERLDANGVKQYEPHVAALAGIWVPETGVVDFPGVCRQLASDLTTAGHVVRFGQRVLDILPGEGTRTSRSLVTTTHGMITARAVVNCGGLWADRLATPSAPGAGKLRRRATGGVRIVPFRGEYLNVGGESAALVKTMIYPVPDPQFPFLGVHLTRGHDGAVHAGPNAVLALARDGYGWGRINFGDMVEMAMNPGVWRLARKHWKTGLDEVARSLSAARYLRSLQRMVPDVRESDLSPAPSGVRAQAVGNDGALLDDFELQRNGRVMNVLNAPSPAATASLAIGRYIADRVSEFA